MRTRGNQLQVIPGAAAPQVGRKIAFRKKRTYFVLSGPERFSKLPQGMGTGAVMPGLNKTTSKLAQPLWTNGFAALCMGGRRTRRALAFSCRVAAASRENDPFLCFGSLLCSPPSAHRVDVPAVDAQGIFTPAAGCMPARSSRHTKASNSHIECDDRENSSAR